MHGARRQVVEQDPGHGRVELGEQLRGIVGLEQREALAHEVGALLRGTGLPRDAGEEAQARALVSRSRAPTRTRSSVATAVTVSPVRNSRSPRSSSRGPAVGVVLGGVVDGQPGQVDRGVVGTPLGCPGRGVVQGRRHVVVARGRRQGEVAGPLLDVAGELREGRVHGAAFGGGRRLVAGLGHQRVGRHDPTVADLDQACGLRFAEGVEVDDRLRRLERRARAAATASSSRRAWTDTVSSRSEMRSRSVSGTGRGRPGARVLPRAQQGPCELDREERVAARRLLQAYERRPAEHVVEVLAQQVVQRTEAERPDVDAQVAVEAVEPQRQRAAPSSARSWRRPRRSG